MGSGRRSVTLISWALPQALAGEPAMWPSERDLISALKEMIESPGPYLLDVQVPYQEHVLPMIPSGMTVAELIKE